MRCRPAQPPWEPPWQPVLVWDFFPGWTIRPGLSGGSPPLEASAEGPETYSRLYAVYRWLYERLKPIYDELAEAATAAALKP